MGAGDGETVVGVLDLHEKVAFLEKTSSYLHDKAGKFTTPFTKKTAWQGEPEFDESSQTYAVQISAPVLDRGETIGVLVVGITLTYLDARRQ